MACREESTREILETEREYVNNLTILKAVYVDPLTRGSPPLVSPADAKAVFSNIEVLLVTNIELLRRLEDRFVDWNDNSSLLGDVFQTLAPFLRSYSAYCQSFDESSQKIAQLVSTNEAVAGVLEAGIHDERTKRRPLSSFLILPVQRVPRYRLMLEKVIHYTEPSHPDYQSLVDALSEISAVAEGVNEKIRDAQHRALILTIQNRLIGWTEPIVAPHRRYLKGGVVTALTTGGGHSVRALFLFNDILVIGSRHMGSTVNLRYKDSLILSTLWVVNDASGLCQAPHAFQLLGAGRRRPHVVFVSSADEKSSWISSIERATEDCCRTIQGASDRREMCELRKIGGSGGWRVVDLATDDGDDSMDVVQGDDEPDPVEAPSDVSHDDFVIPLPNRFSTDALGDLLRMAESGVGASPSEDQPEASQEPKNPIVALFSHLIPKALSGNRSKKGVGWTVPHRNPFKESNPFAVETDEDEDEGGRRVAPVLRQPRRAAPSLVLPLNDVDAKRAKRLSTSEASPNAVGKPLPYMPDQSTLTAYDLLLGSHISSDPSLKGKALPTPPSRAVRRRIRAAFGRLPSAPPCDLAFKPAIPTSVKPERGMWRTPLGTLPAAPVL